jgi:hypothetical protein
MRQLLAAALLLMATAASAAEPAKPLFADDGVIRLTVRGPLDMIARKAEQRPGPRPGSLTIGAETIPIMLSPRGITRLRKETCQFPPLRVEFPQPPAAGLFAGQRRLKLVTHCRPSEGFQQHLLLEYAAYRLYNQLTPASFRVRLAQIDYAGEDGRPVTSRYGFFIEEIDDAARRNGGNEPRVGDRIPVPSLSPRDAAGAAVFEYLIANLDFAMNAGPAGENCCHNFRLIAGAPGTAPAIIPVPYDFDFSGFVDAPYALPPDQIRVSSVRQRHYRGFCRHNAEALAASRQISAQRPALLATLAAIPGLDEKTRRKASAYLEKGFADIASDQAVQAKLFRTCIG